MRRLLALCVVSCHMLTIHGAELTSIDLVPTTDWRYLHNSADVDDAELHAALESSGFYTDWTNADFSEHPVAGLQWQSGTLPIGQRGTRLDWPQELATSIELPLALDRARTVFLRRSFTVPETIFGPIGLELFFEDGATVYLDGQEVVRPNCCVDSVTGEPIQGSPVYVDYANSRSWGWVARAVIDQLAPGEHTLAVSVHGAETIPSRYNRIGLDLRLYSPGNERAWANRNSRANWSESENWLFGLPGSNDFAVFSDGHARQITNDQLVRLAGLRMEHHKEIIGSGTITLGNDSQQGTLQVTGLYNAILNDFRLGNDADFFVDSDSSVYFGGNFDINGRTIEKRGAGDLRIQHAGSSTSPGVLQLSAGTLSTGGFTEESFGGDIISSGGEVRVSHGSTLTVSGDVSAPVTLALVGALAGDAQGTLTIDDLTIDVSGYGHGTGEYHLMPDWESRSIQRVYLPNIGISEWDISRISEGIVSITRTEIAKCDFDESLSCDLNDLNQLLSDVAAGDHNPRSDINNDGQVDLLDRDEWLVEAGTSIGATPFLIGDTNFDGQVNAADLMALGINWQAQASGWENADFNADGIVDAKDLNEMGKNWQADLMRLPGETVNVPNAVPEPMSYLVFLAGGLGLAITARGVPRSKVMVIVIAAIFFPRV